jgi:hypothetical protein
VVKGRDHVNGLDNARVRPAERHHRCYRLELLRVLGDGSEKVPFDRHHRVEARFGEHQFVELVSCGTH